MQNTSLAPLKLLCLDGGGCRGYGQLLLLRQLFRYLLPDASVDDIKPSDYFDLIAGSSSGGILSLMLGRLDFSIGEALDAFQQFTRYIYEKDDVIQAFLAGGVYDSERLERAVDQLLNGKDLPMQHLSENPRARCFITVRHRLADSATPVSCIRSYVDPPFAFNVPARHVWSVKEAACATASSALHFEPFCIKEGHIKFHFEDAGLFGANNPARLALQEVEDHPLWKGREIGCFVSLGSGKSVTVEDRPPELLKSGYSTSDLAGRQEEVRLNQIVDGMLQLATATESVHQALLSTKKLEGIYWRFEPDQGGNLDLADYTKGADLEAALQRYLSDRAVQDRLRLCAEQLRTTVHIANPQGDRVSSTEPPLPHLAEVIGRNHEVEQFVKAILRKQPVVLSGVGGIGKTTAAVACMRRHEMARHFQERRYVVYCHELPSEGNVEEQIGAAISLSVTFDLQPAISGTPSNRVDLILRRLEFEIRRPTLVVLDNLETLTDRDLQGVETIIARLLQISCLSLFITTRDKSLVVRDAFQMGMQPLTSEQTHSLFKAHFDKPLDNLKDEGTARRLGEQMDGHPLSIILIARYARLRGLEVAERHYDKQKSKLLSTGTTKTRLSSLSASIELSLDSIRSAGSSSPLDLLAILSELPDGFPVEPAEAIEELTPDDPNAISALLNLSLVYTREHATMRQPFYRILQPILQHVKIAYPWKPRASARLICQAFCVYFDRFLASPCNAHFDLSDSVLFLLALIARESVAADSSHLLVYSRLLQKGLELFFKFWRAPEVVDVYLNVIETLLHRAELCVCPQRCLILVV